VIAACEKRATLADTANRLSNMADECLLDTRDRGLKYDSSDHCLQLGKLSFAYLNAGGGDPETPYRYEVTFHQARATAWAALAISHSGNTGLSIW
jgi:hypothetical protein